MRVSTVLAISLLSTGCAGVAGVREHDAMIVALARADHGAAIDGAASLGGETLDRAALVSAVLARNPDVDVAREAWRAMVAAYPSAATMPDPMLTYALAPLSIGSSMPFGQRVELSQRLPFPGKRALAGAAVLADAEATRADYEAVRLELAEATVQVFDDYYVAVRALDINTHHREIVERIRATALAQYGAGRGAQQDPLEADGELISLDRERLMIEASRHVAIARINQLLHRAPDAPLPPPPARLTITAPVIELPTHPAQVAATARIRARSAELAASDRAFFPDLELMASYDSMWSDWQHQL
ncbi:MAG: TolC family protein, partial [Proteobacteria bacterium]|nr:TolC family protein [Pseudomonadota bacterium]